MILVTCPKKFSGRNGFIQRNSVENWLRIGLRPHLAGPEEDIASVSVDLDVDSTVVEGCGDVSLLPDFNRLLQVASSKDDLLLGYANADIIFPNILFSLKSDRGRVMLGDEFLPGKFLLVGSRWDLAESIEYEFSDGTETVANIAKFIRHKLKRGEITLNQPDAIDYFIFSTSTFSELPPLVVGRGGYDNALIAYCLRRDIPVIDVSHEWPILHQFHGYHHKKGGKHEVYLGTEAMFNREAHDIIHSVPNSLDADFVLSNGKLIPAKWRCGILRRFELELRYRRGAKWLSYFFRLLQRVFKTQERIEEREMLKITERICSLAEESEK